MTVLFNPFTGKPRHPSDIKSDPKGVLIVEPDAPLLAAGQCGCAIGTCESKAAGGFGAVTIPKSSIK